VLDATLFKMHTAIVRVHRSRKQLLRLWREHTTALEVLLELAMDRCVGNQGGGGCGGGGGGQGRRGGGGIGGDTGTLIGVKEWRRMYVGGSNGGSGSTKSAVSTIHGVDRRLHLLRFRDPTMAGTDFGFYLAYTGLGLRRHRELMSAAIRLACPSLSFVAPHAAAAAVAAAAAAEADATEAAAVAAVGGRTVTGEGGRTATGEGGRTVSGEVGGRTVSGEGIGEGIQPVIQPVVANNRGGAEPRVLLATAMDRAIARYPLQQRRKRLRVGFLSAHFCWHSIGRTL
jgi:hypothetical protein